MFFNILCIVVLLSYVVECDAHEQHRDQHKALEDNDNRSKTLSSTNRTNSTTLLTTQAPHAPVLGKCSDKDDPHGTWNGSRSEGGTYTLICDFGFTVEGEKNTSISCNSEGQWPSDPWCENEDDCERLKYACGPGGLCVDHVGRSECLCEHGAWMTNRSGEPYCDMPGNKTHCGGRGCGAHGVCIKLEDYQGSFDSGASPYRCSCERGFEDNGHTCKAMDCGERTDAKGSWTGSTKYGGEYTLRCHHGTFVWGGSQQAVTVSCPSIGHWRQHFECLDPQEEAKDAAFATMRFWTNLFLSCLCICTAALAAGLTFGLVSLEPININIILAEKEDDSWTKEEKQLLERQQADARKLLDIKKDHHLLLVTLLLLNALANEALPLFLDELMPPAMAILFSVSLVLMCAEVLPSAIFSGPQRFSLAVSCIPLVRFFMKVFYIISNPLARLLDRILDEEEDELYTRCMLRAVLRLHTNFNIDHELDAHHELDTLVYHEKSHLPLQEIENNLIMSVLRLGETKISNSVGFRPIASNKRLSCAKSFMVATPHATLQNVINHALESPLEAVVIMEPAAYKEMSWPIDVPHEKIKAILRIADLYAVQGETLEDLKHTDSVLKVKSDDSVTDVLNSLALQGDMRGFAVVVDREDDFFGIFDGEDGLEELMPSSVVRTNERSWCRRTLAQEEGGSQDILSIYPSTASASRTSIARTSARVIANLPSMPETCNDDNHANAESSSNHNPALISPDRELLAPTSGTPCETTEANEENIIGLQQHHEGCKTTETHTQNPGFSLPDETCKTTQNVQDSLIE